MPTINATWGSNKEIIFNFPKITDIKYSGYKVSSNIANISSTANSISDKWCYATTTVSTKDDSGNLIQRVSSYRSSINAYDIFLRDNNNVALDLGNYITGSNTYVQVTVKPEVSSVTLSTEKIPCISYSLIYRVPTISNISVNRKYSTEQLYVNFNVDACDSYTISVNENTVSNTRILEEKFFNIGLNTITVTCVNGDKTSSKQYTYTFEETQPTVSEFNVESGNNYVDENIELSFKGTTYNRFTVFNNNKQIATGTGSSMIIPKSGLIIGSNKIHVVLYKDLTDSKYGSYTKSVTSNTVVKTLRTYTPTVSNVVLENDGSLIDNNSKLTWQSTYQSKANIYINDRLYSSVTTAKNLTITKGSFKEGQNTVKVEVIKSGIAGVENSETVAYNTTTYNMTRIMPTVSNIKTDGTNIDNPITVSWSSTNQSMFMVLQDGKLITTGQTEKSVTIKEGTLSPTSSTLKVVVIYNSGFDTVTVEEEIAFKGTQNTPIIYGVEPSAITMNIDEVIEVTFSTNEFCDRWELAACGNTFNGTTERKVALPKNSFSKGINVIKLVTYYTPTYNAVEVRTATKTVEFVGFGKPTKPILDDRTVYTTATPTVAWEKNQEQVAYEYIVKLDNEVVEHKSLISTESSVKLGVLENHRTYTISVRVKNSYDLWSEYTVKEFETNFNEIPAPTIDVFAKNGRVLITIKSLQEDTYNGICLFRKTDTTDWLQITDQRINSDDSIVDSTALGKVYYKARVFDTLGGYADSEIKSVDVMVQNYHLSNVQDFTQEMQLDFVKPSYSVVSEVVTKKFAGNSKPRVFKGNTNYQQGSLTVTLENKDLLSFMDFIENGQIFCYRDRRGKKMFVFANIESYTSINAFFMEVSLNLSEVDFKETRIYSGGGWKKIVYLNGSYYLDGSIELSGTVSSEEMMVREERS